MAKEFVIRDDGIDAIEYEILVRTFGKEEADRLVSAPFNDDEGFDEEVDEIIADAPALIED